jgi:hypothetical protein
MQLPSTKLTKRKKDLIQARTQYVSRHIYRLVHVFRPRASSSAPSQAQSKPSPQIPLPPVPPGHDNIPALQLDSVQGLKKRQVRSNLPVLGSEGKVTKEAWTRQGCGLGVRCCGLGVEEGSWALGELLGATFV